MRKITLLFALMVAMVTTAVAQDEIVVTKATRNPAKSALDPSTEYYLQGVRLDFDEEVVKADVEEFGKIVDADGNQVAVLNNCLGANGAFKFATPCTDDKVEVAGTYKVIVYSGVILSVDGEAEYKGGEFEFTVEQHPVVVSPSAEDGLCYNEEFEQESEFREFVISVKYAAEVILDTEKKIVLKHIIKEGWQTVGEEEAAEAEITIVDVDAVEKQIKITFPEQEYAEGSYTFDVPEALFTVDGEANAAYASNTFTYKKPVLTITRDFDSWEAYLDSEYYMPTAAIITIANAEAVEVDETKVATIAIGEDVYNATIGHYQDEFTGDYFIELTFDALCVEGFEFVKGDYTFTFPAGLYTVNGVANEEAVKAYTYGDPKAVAEFSVVAITPAVGQVDSIACIDIEFSNGAKPGILVVTKGEGDELVKYNFITITGEQGFVAVDSDYKVAAITEPGTYTLDLTELDGLTGEKVFTWTIGNTAVETVDAEAENAVIYDHTGRRIEKITKAGIYIINGVTKVVK